MEDKSKFHWARFGGYECSSAGDKRYSAFNAKLPNGLTIEIYYQCIIKGRDPYGLNWKLGKGKSPVDPTKDLWKEYLDMWRFWADKNPDLINELYHHALANNKCLSDCFAKTPINQARALATVLNEWLDGDRFSTSVTL